ncbi:MAG: hypothetical protein V7629_10640 [Motiliproteus sp.]
MLTKILVTALVIFGCYLFIRFKRNRPTASLRVIEVAAERLPASRSPVRMLALGLCVLSLLASALFMGSRWLDNRTLMQVRVISAVTGEVVEYQAYKGDLEGRSFITLYGRQVSIADNERMEITPVNEY